MIKPVKINSHKNYKTYNPYKYQMFIENPLHKLSTIRQHRTINCKKYRKTYYKLLQTDTFQHETDFQQKSGPQISEKPYKKGNNRYQSFDRFHRINNRISLVHLLNNGLRRSHKNSDTLKWMINSIYNLSGQKLMTKSQKCIRFGCSKINIDKSQLLSKRKPFIVKNNNQSKRDRLLSHCLSVKQKYLQRSPKRLLTEYRSEPRLKQKQKQVQKMYPQQIKKSMLLLQQHFRYHSLEPWSKK